MAEVHGPSRRRLFCNDCKRPTWHRLLWGDRRHFDAAHYEEWTIDFADQWLEVWECQGCEDVALSERWATSEDPEPIETFYPDRAARTIKAKKYRNLSLFLAYVYEESIRAFNANCPLLCAAGLRALLEGICDDKDIGRRRRSLSDKIDSLRTWVPASVAQNLHSLRFMGNEALHRLEVPDYKDLALAIEVMEDVMNAIYELDYKSGRLFQRITKQATIPSSDDEESAT